MKRVHLRAQTGGDMPEATRHSAADGSVELAERMFDAAIAALELSERMHGMCSSGGSSRHRIPCRIGKILQASPALCKISTAHDSILIIACTCPESAVHPQVHAIAGASLQCSGSGTPFAPRSP